MGDLKGEFAREPDVTLLPARFEALLARGTCATRGMIAVVGAGWCCARYVAGRGLTFKQTQRRAGDLSGRAAVPGGLLS